MNRSELGNNLSPELRRYAKNENYDPFLLQQDIQTLQHQNPGKVKTIFSATQKRIAAVPFRSLQVAMKGIEKTTEKGFTAFFKMRDLQQSIKPSKLLPWEKWYFEEYKDDPDKGGNPKDPRTWRRLRKEQGVDGRKMLILHLQDQIAISEKDMLRLRDLSVTQEEYNSFTAYNEEFQKHIGRWVTDFPTLILAAGLKNGILSGLPDTTDPTGPLVGGLASSAIYAHLSANSADLLNHLTRIKYELGTQLETFSHMHARTLARFRGKENMQLLMERITTGGRMKIEHMIDKAYLRATGVGITVAQGIVVANEPTKLSRLPFLAGAAFLLKTGLKARTGKEAIEYTRRETALIEQNKEIAREQSSLGRRRAINIATSGVPEKREEIVGYINRQNQKLKLATEGAPLLAVVGANELRSQFDGQVTDNGSALIVNSLILLGAMMPLVNEFTANRFIKVGRDARQDLQAMLTAIETADHRTPTTAEFERVRTRLGVEKIIQADAALAQMRGGDLEIQNLDSGSRQNRIFIEDPIVLRRGKISFLQGLSNRGKTEFGRLITGQQGIIEKMEVRKGVDIRQIDDALYADLFPLVEGASSGVETTLVEQLVPFVKDFNNAFIHAIRDLRRQDALGDNVMRVVKNTLHQTPQRREQVKKIIESLVFNESQRDSWLKDWVQQPLCDIEVDTSDSAVARYILTAAFLDGITLLIPSIDNIKTAADYLTRKPSAEKGVSLGEEGRIELYKTFLKERAVVIIDDLTGKLSGKRIGDKNDDKNISDIEALAAVLKQHLRNNPELVIIVNEHDEKLLSVLDPNDVDKIITCEREGNLTTFKAKEYIEDR